MALFSELYIASHGVSPNQCSIAHPSRGMPIMRVRYPTENRQAYGGVDTLYAVSEEIRRECDMVRKDLDSHRAEHGC
jgi:hypothetical protein